MSFPRNHPFAVEAHFEKSLVLGFAIPREQLEAVIPMPLELDLFKDRWAFLAVAMVKTRGLRPKGFPRIFGRNFTLIGYRVFVRYRGLDGRRLRGLYILGSQTDRRSMKCLGNIFTKYRYSQLGIEWTQRDDGGTEQICSADGLNIVAPRVEAGDKVALPCDSPFADWKQARQFAGPMPFTFSVESASRKIVIVEGVRSSWKPFPISIERWQVPFFASSESGFDFAEAVLANAFVVEDVPYWWKKGRTEKWQERSTL